MRAGQLRKRVIVQKLGRARDDFGQENDVWTNIVTVWASIEPLTGREQLTAQQQEANMTHRIRMRAIPNFRLNPRDRIYFPAEARTFDIKFTADVQEKHFELEIMAEEIL